MENFETAKRYDVASLKERLSKYMDTEMDIDSGIERLERLEEKMRGTSAKEITDMPRAPSAAKDRLAVLVARKDELERELRDIIKAQEVERKWIESLVSRLRRSEQRSVIRMRYLDGERWSTVCLMIFGSRKDYYEKEDSYLRRVMTLHGQALVNMAKMI